MTGHRKQVRHFHEPGDLQELTFSCYRRMPLLTNDSWRSLLCESVDRAIVKQEFRLVAFVLVPEHVLLLVHPTATPVRIDRLLSAIKRTGGMAGLMLGGMLPALGKHAPSGGRMDEEHARRSHAREP